MRRQWELLCLAVGTLRRTPLRMTLTSLGVTISTGALVSMVGFALGVQAQVEEPFQKMELINRINVRPRHEAGTTQPGVEPTPLLDDQALARMANLPGVLLAYPEIKLGDVRIAHGSTVKTVSAAGLPPEAVRLRFVTDSLVAGRFFSPSAEREIILGRRLAQSLGFDRPEDAVGQILVVHVKGLTPSSDGKFNLEQRHFEVMVDGVWAPPGGEHGFNSEGCLFPLDFIKDLPGARVESALGGLWRKRSDAESGYARVVVRVKRPSDLFGVEKHVQEMGFDAQMLLSRFKDMQRGFILMDLLLTSVGLVALTVAGLGILNTLLMSVLERFKEIGVYKALGASSGDICILFLGEAALVGLFGGAGGLVLGRIVSWAIELIVNAVARRYGLDGPGVVFAFPPHLLAGAMLFALIVSLVSGVYPASRAARVDPIRALRAE